MTSVRPLRAYLLLVAILCTAECTALWWATYTGRLRVPWLALFGLALAGALLCDLLAHLLTRPRRTRRRAHARPTDTGGTP